eukprot:4254926-Alexandrium_andersonii.AAC.1
MAGKGRWHPHVLPLEGGLEEGTGGRLLFGSVRPNGRSLAGANTSIGITQPHTRHATSPTLAEHLVKVFPPIVRDV